MHIAGVPISRLKQPNLDIKKNASRRFRLQTNIVLVFVFFTVFREKWLF